MEDLVYVKPSMEGSTLMDSLEIVDSTSHHIVQQTLADGPI